MHTVGAWGEGGGSSVVHRPWSGVGGGAQNLVENIGIRVVEKGVLAIVP